MVSLESYVKHCYNYCKKNCQGQAQSHSSRSNDTTMHWLDQLLLLMKPSKKRPILLCYSSSLGLGFLGHLWETGEWDEGGQWEHGGTEAELPRTHWTETHSEEDTDLLWRGLWHFMLRLEKKFRYQKKL